MNTITFDKASFEKTEQGCGGDCWNDKYVARQAFKIPGCIAVTMPKYRGTGLWLDVQVLINGSWVERRING